MRLRFGVVTLFLVFIIALCVKGTVMSKENSEHARENRYYKELEDDFLEQTRRTLADNGYRDCGVTMTRVTQADGSRQYTVRLHHRKLGRLQEWERDSLIGMLKEGEFKDGICRFDILVEQ